MKRLMGLLLDNTVRILSERIYSFIEIFNLLPSKKVMTFRKTDTSIWSAAVTRFFIMVARFSTNKKIIKKEVNFVVVDESFKMALNVNEYTQCNYYFSFPSESLIDLIKLGGDTFIDIGANVGFFSLYASKKFKNVIAFEPTQASIELLKNNFKMNNIENLSLHELALSDASGKSIFYENPFNQGGNSLEEFGDNQLKKINDDWPVYDVEVLRLDDLNLNENKNLKEIDLIKIDVEGHEAKVLKGARNLLKEHEPMIFAEVGRSKKNHEMICDCLPKSYIAVDPKTLGIINESFHLPWDVLYLTKTKLEHLNKQINNPWTL